MSVVKQALFLTLVIVLLLAQTAAAQDSIETERAIELSGLSSSESWEVEDFQPIDPSDATFRRLLYRTGQVSAASLNQWKDYSADIAFDMLAAEPRRSRFRVLEFSGMAKRVYRYAFSKEDAKDFLSGFFVVICENEAGRPFAIISRSSISSWPRDELLDVPQPIKFQGFFFGCFETKLDPTGRVCVAIEKRETGFAASQPTDDKKVSSADSMPVFIAKRFSWQPTQINAALGVDESEISLAENGVDIGLLDLVRAKSGKPISEAESNVFWQMLSASRTAETAATDRISFAEILGDPVSRVGKAAAIQGRVRQCVPVKITDPKPISQLGSDTWFQLTVFPDLAGRPIHVNGKDGAVEVYRNAFPVTVCMPRLPAGFDANSIVDQSFYFDGFFYRMWVYPSERTDDSALSGQPSPLIMADRTQLIESTGDELSLFIGAIVLAMLLLVGFVSWFVFRSRKMGSRPDLPDRIELPSFENAP